MKQKILKSFKYTFIVYLIGIVFLKVVAHFTNLFHVSDAVFCFAFILGGVKAMLDDEYIWNKGD